MIFGNYRLSFQRNIRECIPVEKGYKQKLTLIAASKNKSQVAKLEVIDLREEEAVAYGNMKR